MHCIVQMMKSMCHQSPSLWRSKRTMHSTQFGKLIAWIIHRYCGRPLCDRHNSVSDFFPTNFRRL